MFVECKIKSATLGAPACSQHSLLPEREGARVKGRARGTAATKKDERKEGSRLSSYGGEALRHKTAILMFCGSCPPAGGLGSRRPIPARARERGVRRNEKHGGRERAEARGVAFQLARWGNGPCAGRRRLKGAGRRVQRGEGFRAGLRARARPRVRGAAARGAGQARRVWRRRVGTPRGGRRPSEEDRESPKSLLFKSGRAQKKLCCLEGGCTHTQRAI